MCLNVKKNSIKKIALKNKVVYKVVKRYTNGCLATPYQRKTIKLGETYNSELIKEGVSVHHGLHSFLTLSEAKEEIFQFQLHDIFEDINGKYKFLIVKCIIPIWSKYYVGKFHPFAVTSNYNDSCASNRLKYIEIIN
jgi:hypothetical protein